MITLQDIQAAVVSVLQQNGYSVIAAEVQEGFERPACFIEVLPVSVTLENRFTDDEQIKTANTDTNVFVKANIQVQDAIEDLNFQIYME